MNQQNQIIQVAPLLVRRNILVMLYPSITGKKLPNILGPTSAKRHTINSLIQAAVHFYGSLLLILYILIVKVPPSMALFLRWVGISPRLALRCHGPGGRLLNLAFGESFRSCHANRC